MKRIYLLLMAVLISQCLAFGGENFGNRPLVLRCRYKYHVQGIAADETGIYWSMSDSVLKTDWQGKKIRELPLSLHCGDVAECNGKIYLSVTFNEPDVQRKLGLKSAVYIIDSKTLAVDKIINIPKNKRPDGIVWHGDRLLIANDRYGRQWHDRNELHIYDRDFNLQKIINVNTGKSTTFGIQVLNFWRGRLLAACYCYKTRKSTFLVDYPTCDSSEVFPVYCAEGFAKVPEKIAENNHTFMVASSFRDGKMFGAMIHFYIDDNGKVTCLSDRNRN